MSQRRMIYEQIWDSDQFNALYDQEKLVYKYYIEIADDDGRFKTSPSRAWRKVFPPRLEDKGMPAYGSNFEITVDIVQIMIERIAKTGLITLYKVDGELYGYHPNWFKYQLIRKDRAKPSNIPSPENAESMWPNISQFNKETVPVVEKDIVRPSGTVNTQDPTHFETGISWQIDEPIAGLEEDTVQEKTADSCQPSDNQMTTSGCQVTTKEKKSKVKKSKENKPKGLERVPQQRDNEGRFGNEGINDMLEAMLKKIGIDDFTDTKEWKRIHANNCLKLLGRIGSKEFTRRLEIITQDSFKRKRCNEIRFVYEQIKAFIEPNIKSNVGYL